MRRRFTRHQYGLCLVCSIRDGLHTRMRGVLVLGLLLLAGTALAQPYGGTTIYRDDRGRTTGRTEDRGDTTVFRDDHGRTAECAEDRGNTTIFRDDHGGTTGRAERQGDTTVFRDDHGASPVGR